MPWTLFLLCVSRAAEVEAKGLIRQMDGVLYGVAKVQGSKEVQISLDVFRRQIEGVAYRA